MTDDLELLTQKRKKKNQTLSTIKRKNNGKLCSPESIHVFKDKRVKMKMAHKRLKNVLRHLRNGAHTVTKRFHGKYSVKSWTEGEATNSPETFLKRVKWRPLGTSEQHAKAKGSPREILETMSDVNVSMKFNYGGSLDTEQC